MKKVFFLLGIVTSLLSCEDSEENAIIEVFEADNGAILRTLEFTNSEFFVNTPESTFSLALEEQDEEDGDLLQDIDVYVSFADNTSDGTIDLSTQEQFLRTIEINEFSRNAMNLPQTQLEFVYSELLEATGLDINQVSCGDQFNIRLVVNLKDERSFTMTNANSNILNFQGFFSSPYCYTINVVEPISQNRFTGTYSYESIQDGPFGPTFGEPRLIDIRVGHSPNVRVFEAKHIRSHPFNELPYPYEFTILCDGVIMEKNQITTVLGGCVGPMSLLGPGDEIAPIDVNNDIAFELWFVEGYNGFDGNCFDGETVSRIRFSRE